MLLPEGVTEPPPTTRDRTMRPAFLIRVLAQLPFRLVRGQALHRRALAAMAAGRDVDAVWLCEAAALRYRRELNVEALARVRVHQGMAAARARGDAAGEADALLDIVRAVGRLDQLESLSAPHALADARIVLSEWLARSAHAAVPDALAGTGPAPEARAA